MMSSFRFSFRFSFAMIFFRFLMTRSSEFSKCSIPPTAAHHGAAAANAGTPSPTQRPHCLVV